MKSRTPGGLPFVKVFAADRLHERETQLPSASAASDRHGRPGSTSREPSQTKAGVLSRLARGMVAHDARAGRRHQPGATEHVLPVLEFVGVGAP